MKTATIDTNTRGQIVVRTDDGTVISRRNTYCNPAALEQAICDAEMAGAEIDWDASGVAKPEDAA